MKTISIENTLLELDTTNKFDKQLKKIFKQGKDLEKLISVVEKLANKGQLEPKYKDHQLINDKTYKDCRECHIEPDWLLIYKYQNDSLILVLFATGTHSELFDK
ncbi:MAG: type II toxin-antitoxin system YafQ family toxin [Bacilli bacterium]|nr:type II toxin-antitoxin system YafQ family toxin [Bacilli bacterium]